MIWLTGLVILSPICAAGADHLALMLCETFFGPTITLSTGRVIPTRWVGEQHVKEDLGHIPSFADWARAIRPEPWMGRTPSDGEEIGQDFRLGHRDQHKKQIEPLVDPALSEA